MGGFPSAGVVGGGGAHVWRGMLLLEGVTLGRGHVERGILPWKGKVPLCGGGRTERESHFW